VSVLLLATYEMGRQPFGLASPAAWLREAGLHVAVRDLSRQTLDPQQVREARLVACYVPMHTATRLLPPVVRRVRKVNPTAVLCAYGLYAPLNERHLRELGFTTVLGPEFEDALRTLALQVAGGGVTETAVPVAAPLPRLSFRVPDRDGLPPLDRYAGLRIGDERRTTGYTEATRGCKHRCRHCPIVPVYDGRFRVVSADVVIEDVRRQVAQGARHITFGDPDFFNGPTHAMTVVEALAAACPGVSYDVTIKVEHLLRHVDLLPRLRDTGCILVTSAVESLDDDVLARLEKGHTRLDVARAVAACRDAGLALTPTFVAFTPWTTIDGYRALLRGIAALDLIDAVASIQLGIRLLVTEGSRLLELDDVRGLVGAFDRMALVYPWRHPDAAVDALQQAVSVHVGRRVGRPRAEVFREIWELAYGHAPDALDVLPAFPPGTVTARADVPWLDEPWYC
jgi:radical SAM superfamily enzyme YgiQ (UPF0313 family)